MPHKTPFQFTGPSSLDRKFYPGVVFPPLQFFLQEFSGYSFKIVFTCPRHPVIPPEVKSAFGRFWALGVQINLSQVVVEFKDLL